MRTGGPRTLAPYLLVSLLTLAPAAWAYLDPSTGSMILSAIIGIFATAALAVKTWWYKLRGYLRRSNSEPAEREREHSPQTKPPQSEAPRAD